jgi:hypothetical protein
MLLTKIMINLLGMKVLMKVIMKGKTVVTRKNMKVMTKRIHLGYGKVC